MNPIIFHPYSMSRPHEQFETWECLETLKQCYPVYNHLCSATDDYDRGLYSVWNKGHGLVIIEQDIVSTQDMVRNLIDSQDIAAAQAYYLHTIEPEPVLAHRQYTDNMATRWIEQGETQGDLIGLGFAYFSAEAQTYVDIAALSINRRWDNLDVRLSQVFYSKGITFSIHYPVAKHNHLSSALPRSLLYGVQ